MNTKNLPDMFCMRLILIFLFSWNLFGQEFTGRIIHGDIAQISVGAFGTPWGLDEKGQVYTRINNQWILRKGRERMKQISVGSGRVIYAIEKGNHSPYVRDFKDTHWIKLDGKLKWISASADKQIWGINNNGVAVKLSNSKWEIKSKRKFKRITAGNKSRVFALNAQGSLFRYFKGVWIWQKSPKLKEISAGFKGGLIALKSSGELIRKSSKGWKKIIIRGPSKGKFSLLSYNIGGLPGFISKIDPKTNLAKISPRINQFDIVLMQENFAYYKSLMKYVFHPYQTKKIRTFSRGLMGDGLNRLSNFPFENFERAHWDKCSGFFTKWNDCMTWKGLSYAHHEIAPGVFIDIYNVHSDAGGALEDFQARKIQFNQIVKAINEKSQGLPVIIAGDFNIGYENEEDKAGAHYKDRRLFSAFLLKSKTLDSCYITKCKDVEIHDKITFRSGEDLKLKVSNWRMETGLFSVKDAGPLSDHEPVAVDFSWSLKGADDSAPLEVSNFSAGGGKIFILDSQKQLRILDK